MFIFKLYKECGITYHDQNARIVGGTTAIAHSWPATALIISNYKADLNLGGQTVYIDISFMCGGTLINRKTVLTAAHCIVRYFDYTFKGLTYTITVRTNNYYPTLENMYRVYLGIQDRTLLNSASGNIDYGSGVYRSISKIRVVRICLHSVNSSGLILI